MVLVSDFGRRRITCFGYVMHALLVEGQTKIWHQRGRHIVTSVDGWTLRYGAIVGAILIDPYCCTDHGQYVLGT